MNGSSRKDFISIILATPYDITVDNRTPTTQLLKMWLAQEISKWHLSLLKILPSSKFWKSENGPISWTKCNIVMKTCMHIDIDKM